MASQLTSALATTPCWPKKINPTRWLAGALTVTQMWQALVQINSKPLYQ